MQEVITVKMTREEYSQLIKSQTNLDFLQSDYDFKQTLRRYVIGILNLERFQKSYRIVQNTK